MGWGWLKALWTGLLGFFKETIKEDYQASQASKAEAKEKQLESSAKVEAEEKELEVIIRQPPKIGTTDLDTYVRGYKKP